MSLKKEQTFVMLKPDAIQRSLVGTILTRIEQTGLKLTAMKMVTLDKETAYEFYKKSDEWYNSKGDMMVENLTKAGLEVEKTAYEYGKGIIESLVIYMCAGPVVQLVVEGNSAVGIVQKIIGSTEPMSADVGTIRFDYAIDTYELANLDFRAVRNLIHRSDDVEDAKTEIGLWFAKEEIISYRHLNEAILYDVNLDGIME